MELCTYLHAAHLYTENDQPELNNCMTTPSRLFDSKNPYRQVVDCSIYYRTVSAKDLGYT